MKYTKSERGSCFFFVVGTILVLVIGLCAMAYFAYRYAVNTVVEDYAETTPRSFFSKQLPSSDALAILNKAKDFIAAINKDEPTETLVLSGPEFNFLLADLVVISEVKSAGKNTSSHEAEEIKNYVREHFLLDIENDTLVGEVSIPLEWIGHPDMFFNGSAAFQIMFRDNRLNVNLVALSARGVDAPDEVIAALSNENLAEGLENDKQAAEFLEKLESIEIKDNKLFLVPKNSSS